MSQLSSPFILSIEEGQDLFQNIEKFIILKNMRSAVFSGIGAISHVTLGYYNNVTQEHITKKFHEPQEITSLTGNITRHKNSWFTHIHVAISNEEFLSFGGHLLKAKAGASTEISIFPMNTAVKRIQHPSLNIKVIPSAFDNQPT